MKQESALIFLVFFLSCFALLTGCASSAEEASDQEVGAFFCIGESYGCEPLELFECESRSGCRVHYADDPRNDRCVEDPPGFQACSAFDSENSCNAQGGCNWEKLSDNEILRDDYDGDQVDESIWVSEDQNIIGITDRENGTSEVVWFAEGWVNHPVGTGNTGWNLRAGDRYFTGDFDGDGNEDIVIAHGRWLGLLEVNDSDIFHGSLHLVALGIIDGWVNHEDSTGKTGWHLRNDDLFEVRQVAGGPDEIVVRSSDGKWEGIIYRKDDTLYAGTITGQEFRTSDGCEYENKAVADAHQAELDGDAEWLEAHGYVKTDHHYSDEQCYPLKEWEPSEKDSDGDGLSDYYESNFYTLDPQDPDIDGDGLLDGYEFEIGTWYDDKDSDRDGWEDKIEDDWWRSLSSDEQTQALSSGLGCGPTKYYAHQTPAHAAACRNIFPPPSE